MKETVTGCERDDYAPGAYGDAESAGAEAVRLPVSAGADAEPSRRAGGAAAADADGAEARAGGAGADGGGAEKSHREVGGRRAQGDGSAGNGAEGQLCGGVGLRDVSGEDQPGDRGRPYGAEPVF